MEVTASQQSGRKDAESSSERVILTVDAWIIGILLLKNIQNDILLWNNERQMEVTQLICFISVSLQSFVSPICSVPAIG